MINPQLTEYIRQQFAAGVTKEEIVKSLAVSGWQISDINEAFASISPSPSIQMPVQNSVQPTVSSHKGMIAAVIVLLLLVSAGGAFAAYYYGLFGTTTPSITPMTASNARARAIGNDDAIRSDLSTIQYLYHGTNDSNYTDVCSNPVVVKALTSVQKANGGTAPICNTSTTTYAVSSPLLSGGYWCVDSTGAFKATSSLLSDGETSCGS